MLGLSLKPGHQVLLATHQGRCPQPDRTANRLRGGLICPPTQLICPSRRVTASCRNPDLVTKVEFLMIDKRLGRMEHPPKSFFSTTVMERQALIPAIYGGVDFNQLPERYEQAFDINRLRPSKHRDYCQRVLERPELIELIQDCTMTGDAVADAYAALMPEYGFKTLVTMLD